jgi:hypothetical protein
MRWRISEFRNSNISGRASDMLSSQQTNSSEFKFCVELEVEEGEKQGIGETRGQ